MKCSDCIHSNPQVYIDLWERRRGGKGKLLHNYILQSAYSKVHCRMVKKDADNFPHKLGEMSNWDETIMPQHCGHFEKRPALLLFQIRGRAGWQFIGAYSTPEICQAAEKNILNPRVISSLVEFKQNCSRYNLVSIANSLIVKIPVLDSELTHEMVWSMLQMQLSDNDTFDKINAHEYIASIFPIVGSRNRWEIMVRFGMYKMVTLRGVITDLRSEKYSRIGRTLDIRPMHPRRRYIANNSIELDGKWENESRYWEEKMYVRVK